MKYTEEVKKAIEAMKDKLDNDENSWFYYDEIETIFDLLEKQQKEIERLYKDNYRLDRENQLKFERAVDTSDYVNKDKIREKIKEFEKVTPEDREVSKVTIDTSCITYEFKENLDYKIAQRMIKLLQDLLEE